MSDLSPPARQVLAILQGLEGEPITLRDLTSAVPFCGRRDIELACQELALAGWPLVSRTEIVWREPTSMAEVHAAAILAALAAEGGVA